MRKNIKSVEEKQSAKGTYLRVTWDDGKADNIFKKEHQDVIHMAHKDNLTVEVTKEKQGAYWNVTNVVLPSPFNGKESPAQSGETEPATQTSAAKETKEQTTYDSSKLRSMSISYAKDLAAAGVIAPTEILEYADTFLSYIEK